MKADKYGTIAEQIRHQAGWLPAKAADQRRGLPADDASRIDPDQRCGTCCHLSEPDLTAGPRANPICDALSVLTTRRRAWCTKYQPLMDLHQTLATPATDALVRAIQRRARLAGGQHD
jgi:hypothetical protein